MLDEATSALDNQSEMLIQDALEKLMAKTAWNKMIITRSRVRLFKRSEFLRTTTALIIFLTIRGKAKLIIDVKTRHAKAKIMLLVYGRAYFRIFANSFI